MLYLKLRLLLYHLRYLYRLYLFSFQFMLPLLLVLLLLLLLLLLLGILLRLEGGYLKKLFGGSAGGGLDDLPAVGRLSGDQLAGHRSHVAAAQVTHLHRKDGGVGNRQRLHHGEIVRPTTGARGNR